MRRVFSFLLPFALLLAVAAPVAAADERPAPDAPVAAPEGVLYATRGYEGALPITTPEEAHAAVVAAGAPFAAFVPLTSDLVGADSWYEVKGEAGSDALWTVVYTYGWGDCPAGCTSTHSFVYLVDPLTGAVTFDSHAGDELPADAPADLVALTGRSGGVVPQPEWRTLTGVAPEACPAGINEPDASISSDVVLPCLLPDGSLFPIAVDDGSAADWAARYDQWMAEYRATLQPCAEGVDPNDMTIAACLLPDGSIAGPVPLFAMAADGTAAEGGWTSALPGIIFAGLIAWILAAAFVGWRRERAA